MKVELDVNLSTGDRWLVSGLSLLLAAVYIMSQYGMIILGWFEDVIG